MQALILDTNILLDIFVFDDVRANPLRAALLKQEIKAYSCRATLDELADVISRPLFSLEAQDQASIISQWQSLSHELDELNMETAPWQCQDPDDQIFLNIAYTLRPAILISKDHAVLKLAGKAAQENVLITADYSAFQF
jgi:putative PIN family toxin of toxin-antitoxin system